MPGVNWDASASKGKDAPCPPMVDGKLNLFNMRYCPYAQRAALVAIAKGADVNLINVGIYTECPDFLKEKNPAGTVPVIQTGDFILPESLLIADYLDEAYPSPKLHPDCPKQKALDRVLVDRNSQAVTLFYKIAYGGGDQDAEMVENFHAKLDYVEKELAARRKKNGGKAFFGGDEPKMVDFMIWPWTERYLVFPIIAPKAELTADRFPELLSWIENMKANKVIAEYLLTPEDHIAFFKTAKTGKPVYDLKPPSKA